MQWLSGQYKAKIKSSIPNNFIEAKQGTMLTNTGHDPNWKKRIRINFYELEGNNTLIRVEAMPLARNVFRIEKLKQSWYNGLFVHLFSLLGTIEQSSNQEEKIIMGQELKFCSYCGKKIENNIRICPYCGSDTD